MAHVKVIIAGAGPSGLTMSALLARMKVKHLVVEKAPSISTHPMAHYVNVRTMEILREIGMVEKHVKQLSPPRSAWEDFVWCTSISGRTLFRMTHKSIDMKSFCESVHLSQNKITPYLLQEITKPENSSYTDVKFNCAIENFQEYDEKITVKLSNDEEVTCDYLIGADGASSNIRSQLGIGMSGKTEPLQTLMNIHFKCSPGLKWSNNQAAMLFFVYNPKCVAVFVAHDLEKGEWVMQVPFFPPFQTPENSFSLEQCKEIVMAGLGVENSEEVEVLSAAPWTMDAKVAKKYSSDSKRVLLIGDAVHRFPPAGGFGMNTGIQDAHNLAWKLASVLHKKHSACLLNSYEAERRPVAIANTILSLKNYDKVLHLAKTIGLDSKHLDNKVFQNMSMNMGRTAISLAQSQLGCLSIKGHPLGEVRIANLSRVLREGGGLPLFYPKHELEFGYTKKQQYLKEKEAISPSIKPMVGYRIPHCRMSLSYKNKNALCSFLDISYLIKGSPCFIVIVGKGKGKNVVVDENFLDQPFIKLEVKQHKPSETEDLSTRYQQYDDMAPSLNSLDCFQGEEEEEMFSESSSSSSFTMNNNSIIGNMMMNMECEDIYGDWDKSFDGKALVLRPDGHILWIQESDLLPSKLSLVLDEHSLLVAQSDDLVEK